MARTRTATLLIIAVCTLFSSSIIHAKKAPDIHEIKAGLIYHIAKLVNWPEKSFVSDEAPVVIGFMGESVSETAGYFEQQAPHYEAQNRPLEVRRIIPAETENEEDFQRVVDSMKECHILFVSPDMEIFVNKVLEREYIKSLLLIGETMEFAENGGMLSLVEKNKRMKIIANLDNLEAADLKVSARFLQHAEVIENK